MAGKARRAASRQGQLNRKRKRTQKGPSGIPASPRNAVADAEEEAVAVAAGVETAEAESSESGESVATAPAEAPSPARPAPAARTPRGDVSVQGQQGRLRGERPAAYLYVGAEVLRIGFLAGAVLAALIVLGIVL